MTEKKQGSISFSQKPMEYMTKPKDKLNHYISDEELTDLCRMKKDNIIEIFWGTLGLCLGTIFTFSDTLRLVRDGKVVSLRQFIESGAFTVSLALTVFCAIMWYKRNKYGISLESDIRSRPKDVVS